MHVSMILAGSINVALQHSGLALRYICELCREEENEMATENAIAALGRVLEHHGGAIEESAAAQSWNVWVSSLPVVEDKVEARYVHAQLVRHVEASDPRWATCLARLPAVCQ